MDDTELRDFFAGCALIGQLCNVQPERVAEAKTLDVYGALDGTEPTRMRALQESIARGAWEIADAMLRARDE